MVMVLNFQKCITILDTCFGSNNSIWGWNAIHEWSTPNSELFRDLQRPLQSLLLLFWGFQASTYRVPLHSYSNFITIEGAGDWLPQISIVEMLIQLMVIRFCAIFLTDLSFLFFRSLKCWSSLLNAKA